MRRAFLRALVELADEDSRIVLLTGDLGFTVVEPFAERFPTRFFNVGVAEQNMVGVATGLAEAGFVPFAYSIATFASLRPYEFIRNGPVRHGLPVRVVGAGGGFDYGTAGHTHHALEDLGVLRLQPGLAVLAPADADQAVSALRATSDEPGPVYFRVGKGEGTVPGLEGRFALGRVELLSDGDDLLLLSAGAAALEASAAVDALAGHGIACTHGILATLAPTAVEALAELVARFSTVITVEAHYATGGLGSLVSEVVAERGLGCRVIRCGAGPSHGRTGGSRPHLEAAHGLTNGALVETALRALRPSRRGP